MYILFAISILCFFALVLVTVAMARHARSRRVPANPQPDFAQHLFAAVKNHDSRTSSSHPRQDQRVIAKTNLYHAFEPTLADTRNQSIPSKRF
jgi:uncharacterized MAPEG superfamily protein